MTFDKFKSIFTVLYNETKNQNNFVDCLPSTIKQAIFDNEYTNSLAREKRLLLKHLFTQPVFEDIDYFLYDFKVGFRIIIDEKEYAPANFEGILYYFQQVHFPLEELS